MSNFWGAVQNQRFSYVLIRIECLLHFCKGC